MVQSPVPKQQLTPAHFDTARRFLLALENDRRFYDSFCAAARNRPKVSLLRTLVVDNAHLDATAWAELKDGAFDTQVRRTVTEMIVRYLLDQWNLPHPDRKGDAFCDYPTICLFDEKEVCLTCEGKGTIDETIGGGEPQYLRSDAPCPDCAHSALPEKTLNQLAAMPPEAAAQFLPKETIMNAPIEITTKTLINGQDIVHLSDATIYDTIAAQELEIERLEAIKSKPKKLVAEIEKRRAGIQALVDYLDSKE